MDNMKLRQWAIDKIKREYPDDVALLIALKGHSVNGDGHGECFDYFVPATARGNELARTFIVEGIGTDLYPRSWERTERTASLDDEATICLGNAEIVYSRSAEDTARFEAIQKKLFDNLANREFVYKKALARIDEAMELYRNMMFEDRLFRVRAAAGFIGEYLSNAIMYINGTYPADWRVGNLCLLSRLSKVPDGFTACLDTLLRANDIDNLRDNARRMIMIVRAFTAENAPARSAQPTAPDYHALANWYQELSLTWRRLKYYADIGDAEMAFTDACNLQSELTIVKEEFGVKECDLLGAFDKEDLSKLKARAIEHEAYIASTIEAHGVKIERYDSLDDLIHEVP